jgi:hypothetical protein
VQSHPIDKGSANSKLRPLGNSASKKEDQRFATSSGTIPALASSNENCASLTSSIFFTPERVKTIDMSVPFPGETQSILQNSEPPTPLSIDSKTSVLLARQGTMKSANASSCEQNTDDNPLHNVFGPTVVDWLRDKFPNLR